MNTSTDVTVGNHHFIGLGGAGMSVIAQLFLDRGWPLTGSDQNDSKELAHLREQGVECWVGSSPQSIPEGSTIVYSTAVRPTNPERAWAREKGWPEIHRSQALALASKGQRFVAVAGAHGKTTTSAYLATILQGIGADPSFAIGGTVKGFGTGGHLGKGDVFIAEADESDKSFLNYRPALSIITNIEADHLVNYGSLEAIEEAFYQFAKLGGADGQVLVCADSPACVRLAAKLVRDRQAGDKQVPTIFGYGKAAALSREFEGLFAGYAQIEHVQCLPDSVLGAVRLVGEHWPEQPVIELQLNLPGEYNLINATAALTAGMLLGFEGEQLAQAFSGYAGVGRRFDLWGEVNNVRVYDDYAHHPTEITALMQQARAAAGQGKVRVVFEPHLFSRTREQAQGFARTLQLADEIIVCDIYPAREDPDPNTTSDLIVSKMDPSKTTWIHEAEAAAWELGQRAEPGDLLLTIGPGTIWQKAQTILRSLQDKFPGSPILHPREA